jgi:dTDP-4-amino-4,6-dideoxygalactose transaminase
MAVKHAGYEVNFVDDEWVGTYQLSPFALYDSAVRFTQGMYKDGFQCLSFHIKKHIPIGRGGMILTDDKKAATGLRGARYDGRPSPFWKDVKDIQMCGWHMYMTPDQAARGVELFHRLPKLNYDLASWRDYSVDLSTLKAFK